MKIRAAKTEANPVGDYVGALVPSAGILTAMQVEDGKLKMKTKGRPSGQMDDGSHGDHVSAQILPVHGIRRAANGIEVKEIDDLRDASASASVDGYMVDNKAIAELYARIGKILDEYNERRYKKTELSVLQKVWDAAVNNGLLSNLNLSQEERLLVNDSNGLQRLFDAHIAQNNASNGLLICETFARLIESASTYYYKVPNTAYHKIRGYEASEAEGGNINATLARLDAILGVSGDEFRQSVMKAIKAYCVKDDVEEQQMIGLEAILLPGQMQKEGVRERK